MTVKNQTAEKPTFYVGDAVSFAMSKTQRVSGVVVEDRGPLGWHGRRLYGVQFQMSEYSEPQYIELPAADLRKNTPRITK